MKLKIALDTGATMQTRAHEWDAGLDLYTPRNVRIDGKKYSIIDTGVHVEIPKGYVGMIKSKSGLNVRKHLTAEGVIDAGYTGSIVVKMYNHGIHVQNLKKGDKLTQLVILPIAEIEALEMVDSLDENTERGSNGFGSSGR